MKTEGNHLKQNAAESAEKKRGERSGFALPKAGLPGNLAQLLIFALGTLLTLAAYISLDMVAGKVIKNNHAQWTSYAEATATNALDTALLSVDSAAGTVLSGAQRGGIASEEISQVRDTFDRETILEGILYLHRKKNGTWESREIFRRPDADFPSVKPLIQSLPVLSDAGDMLPVGKATIIPASGTETEIRSVDPLIRDKRFYIVNNLGGAISGQDDYLLATANFYNLYDQAWFEDNRPIKHLSIVHAESDEPFFLMESTAPSEAEGEVYNKRTSLYDAGGSRFAIMSLSGENLYMNLVGFMPFIVLISGILLTILSTLFVRDRQKQSYRFQSIANMLARKNYDLNMEVARREQLHFEIRKTEREYKAIIDAISDVIFEITPRGDILFLNKTWETVTGFGVKETLEDNIFSYLHPEDKEDQRENLKDMISGRRHAYRIFTKLKTEGEEYRAVEMAVSMLKQDEEHKLRIVGSFIDVEEYRKAERALGEAKKKYEAMVNNAAGGIYQISPEGMFISANPSMARILEYSSPEELVDSIESVNENLYVDPLRRKRFLKSLMGKTEPQHFEGKLRTRNDNIIWVRENVRAVYDHDGDLLYYEGSMEDITKRREAEIKLREAKIQSDLSSRAKTEFLANISHELRTPLNSIIGFSEIIKNEVLGPIENRQYHDYAVDIYQSGKSLLKIINEILDVSHIEAGDRKLNETVVSVKDLVASCVDFTRVKAKQNYLTLQNQISGNVPNIIGEEVAIKQILLNLLSNAVKFTLPGGFVTVTAETDRDGSFRLSVTDTGVGLDETEIEKALSPFGQIDVGTNKAVTGVGLGLTLVDSLIRLHGGRLELFSQKGVGTTATIIFPSDRVLESKEETEAAEKKHGDSRENRSRRKVESQKSSDGAETSKRKSADSKKTIESRIIASMDNSEALGDSVNDDRASSSRSDQE